MLLYLAGALSYLHRQNKFDEALKWRGHISAWAYDNHIKLFNPALTFLKEQAHSYSDKMIVFQNDYYINNADICIVQADYIDFSLGTMYEVTRFKEQGKPVIAFGEKSWNPHFNTCISQYCKDIEEVIEVLTNMFAQSFNR